MQFFLDTYNRIFIYFLIKTKKKTLQYGNSEAPNSPLLSHALLLTMLLIRHISPFDVLHQSLCQLCLLYNKVTYWRANGSISIVKHSRTSYMYNLTCTSLYRCYLFALYIFIVEIHHLRFIIIQYYLFR